MKPSLTLAIVAACLLGACAAPAPQTSALGPGVTPPTPQIEMHLMCDRGRLVGMVVTASGRGTWATDVELDDFRCPPPPGSV